MRSKFNYKVIAITLGSLAVVASSIIGICASTSRPNNLTLSTKSGTITIPTDTTKLKQKIGAVRHYQNNSFNGVKLKNGGFIALTGDASATRTDMFGNIIWEFDPKTISSGNTSDFSSKKVIEVVQDETNSSIFYLLLVPTEAPNELADIDPNDPTYYDQMIGSNPDNVKWQASVVQIQENIYNYSASTWSPYFTILDHVNIDPQQMVNNYPSSWKNDNMHPLFFDKKDHPSWYINGASEKVNPATPASSNKSIDNQSSHIKGDKDIVLPWKQYITNLGNMYAKDGQVFIFGGNGSMYNDPEALSIGMFRITFGSSLVNTQVTGIPYAYLLSNLEYNPTSSQGTPATKWNKCYAPIKQDANFNYVPRLAVGGVQTNVTSGTQFLYLSGAITVGQVANSQNRAWKPKEMSGSNSLSDATATSLQQQRSLQLSGPNVLSTTNESDTTLPAERNSIDPCLLFGTAFNISELGSVKIDTNPNASTFSKVLVNNSYFDIGSTVGNSSTSGTYYFFDQKQLKASNANGSGTTNRQITWSESSVKENSNRLLFESKLHKNVFAPSVAPTLESTEVRFPLIKESNYTAFDFFKDGKSRPVYEFKDLTTDVQNIKVDGTAMASYSWNLPLLVDNARNYYYPTLCYGYSLKSVSSLTKVSHGSQAGYAMQVGKSILFINEPKFDNTSLVYHGPSSVSIGTETDFGTAKFGNTTINHASNSQNDYVYKFADITGSNSKEPSAIEIMKQLPFSYSGDLQVDKSILATGTTQLVAGIKDLNLTVSDIAGTFKISTDPYATTTTTKNTLSSPTLAWNQFMGLTSTTDGSSVASSWANTTTSPEQPTPKAVTNSIVVPTKSKHFALTSQSTFSDFSSKAWQNNLTFQDGVKQGWFENTSKQVSTITDGKTAIDVVDANMINVTKDTYFKSTTSGNNPGVVFDHGLSKSGNPVIYGQQILTSNSGNLNNGIAYVNVDTGGYKTAIDVTSTEVLGKTSFKTNVTFETLGITNIDQLFDKSFNNGQAFITNDNQYISLVKNEYVSKLLENSTAPEYSNTLDSSSKPTNNSWYQIYAFIDSKKTKIHFVAYAWNPLTKAYDMSPAASGGGFAIGNEITLPDVLPDYPANNGNKPIQEQEHIDDSWIIPVAVTVPIALILIGLIVFFVIKSRKNKY